MTGVSVTGHFADLKVRLTSAAVLASVGAAAIWAGGLVFLFLLAAVSALMIWELLRMLNSDISSLRVGMVSLIAAASVVLAGLSVVPLTVGGLLLAPVVGLYFLHHDRGIFLSYGAVILFSVAGLFWVRQGGGILLTSWLILVVVAADIGGYCFGRLIGGAKIIPKISPKKTWSGTLGGLILAGGVGSVYALMTSGGYMLIGVSFLAAMASQIGDVVESAVKRHCSVKDSSNFIPGHGGFLDRFDALIAASFLVTLACNVLSLEVM